MIDTRLMKPFLILFISCCPFVASTQDSTTAVSDTFFCGNTRIVFFNNCRQDSARNVSFVHVHEDETTAVQAAAQVLDTTSGECLVTWQCQQQRFIDFVLEGKNYRFDPNRIYTLPGIHATLKSNGAYTTDAALAVREVAEEFKEKYVNGFGLVVALHNNTNGGGLTVNSYKKGGPYAKDATMVYVNAKQDTDDFFFTTQIHCFKYLKAKGYNVVLQNNSKVKDDGSLSVFCANQQIPYINIEAQYGHLQLQAEMLKVVLKLIVDLQFRKMVNDELDKILN